MTATTTLLSRTLAPVLLGLAAALGAVNWYLAPARAGSWLAALGFLAVLALILWVAPRRVARASSPHAIRNIRNGIVFAALIIAVSLGAKLAVAVGAVADAELARRLSNITFGAFFVITGNALPKMLTPLSASRCGGAGLQAAQRFAGWTWVLTGLAFAIAWLVLPARTAEPLSIALLVSSSLLVMARTLQLRRTRHGEA